MKSFSRLFVTTSVFFSYFSLALAEIAWREPEISKLVCSFTSAATVQETQHGNAELKNLELSDFFQDFSMITDGISLSQISIPRYAMHSALSESGLVPEGGCIADRLSISCVSGLGNYIYIDRKTLFGLAVIAWGAGFETKEPVTVSHYNCQIEPL